MPDITVAGSNGFGACVAVVDGEVEGDGAVAADDVDGMPCCVTASSKHKSMPNHTVAGSSIGVASGGVVNVKVEGYCTITTHGVSQRMGGNAVAGGVGLAVYPSVAVARCLYISACSAFADGEVESNGTVAACGVGEYFRWIG